MRAKRKAFFSAALVLGVLWPVAALADATADARPETPCANFGRVVPGLYRGAEPSDLCLDHLVTIGVRMVVNLREGEKDSGREQEKVLAHGMRYLNLPMSGFASPSIDEVQRVLAVVCAPENQPVFLHCKRGGDRTGVIVAAHRMAHEGWPTGMAVQEAESYGLAWWQFRMKKFLRDFRENATGASSPAADEVPLCGSTAASPRRSRTISCVHADRATIADKSSMIVRAD